MRESRDETAPRHVDVPGLIAVSGGVIALTLGIDRGPGWGWTSPRILGVFTVAAVLLVGFVVLEHRVRAPLVPPELLGNRALMVMSGSGLASNFNFALSIFCVTLFLLHDVSVMVAGVLFLAFSIAAAVGDPASGKLSTKYSLRSLMAVGVLGLLALDRLGVLLRRCVVARYRLWSRVRSHELGHARGRPRAAVGCRVGFRDHGAAHRCRVATTLAATLIEQLQHGHGAHAEGVAIEGVLRVGVVVALLGAAALPFVRRRSVAVAPAPASTG